jgi:hypothetical protein
VRVHDTRGLKLGSDFDSLYEMKDRTIEQWGDPTATHSDNRTILIEADFNEDGSIVFQQDWPLPATVLGFVLDADVGDDGEREDRDK